jgi:streptomycin 6-kinase
VDEWGLTDLEPLPTSYVGLSVVLQGRSPTYGDVVVKLTDVDGGSRREAVALRAWDGRGAVRLLAHDVHRPALLLERLTPGTPLTTSGLDDDTATRTIAEVAARLAITPTGEAATLPDYAEWVNDFNGYGTTYGVAGPIDPDLVTAARQRLDDLLTTAPAHALLHGDLHHDNVLLHQGEWVAIDPKGHVGDPASEPAQMLFNPMPYVSRLTEAELSRLVLRRLDVWAEASSLDPERVRGWALVKSVVAEIWDLEDGPEDKPFEGLPSRVGAVIMERERMMGPTRR